MKIELSNIYAGNPVDPEDVDFDQSMVGYPSFMKRPIDSSVENMKDCNQSYSICHGPSPWRAEFTNILENLVSGEETDADLAKMDDMLMRLYVGKKPVNKTEEQQMDFHQRKTKEIRRLQYAESVREKNIEKLGESGVKDGQEQDPMFYKSILVDPNICSSLGVDLPRPLDLSDPHQDDVFEERLNSSWEHVARLINFKIKNYVTQDGLTKEIHEDIVDSQGCHYRRRCYGNIKRMNHPNYLPSTFVLLENCADEETGQNGYRSLDGWVMYSAQWGCAVEYFIDEHGIVKVRELTGRIVIDNDNVQKQDGTGGVYYIVEERNDQNG